MESRRLSRFIALQWPGLIAGMAGGALLTFFLMTNARHFNKEQAQSSTTTSCGPVSVEMEAELAVCRHGTDVQSRVAEALRLELVARQKAVEDAEQGLVFFRSILKSTVSEDIYIERLAISQDVVSGNYSFKLALIQPLDNNKPVSGEVRLSLDGIQDGKKLTLGWSVVAGDPVVLPFSLKVFEELSGTFRVPPTFMPSSMNVSVAIAGRKAPVQKAFPWIPKRSSST